ASNLAFTRGAWSAPLPEIAIFDTTFVHQNVFAGDRIDHDHKRNLYRVIIGEAGIQLAANGDKLDGESRDAAKTNEEKRALALARFPRGTDLTTAAKLPAEPDIAAKLAEKEKELKNAEAAASKASEIKSK